MINNRHVVLAARFACYALVYLAYLAFMARHAPAGIDWVPYHGQRIFNAVEFLRLNGYFSSYGYSIWNSCVGCDLTSADLTNSIYLSNSALKLAPYIFMNEVGGKSFLLIIGPVFDQAIIFLTGALVAELFIKIASYASGLPKIWVGVASFLLFVTAPWTYKMITAAWMEIYFLAFYLLAMWLFLRGQNRTACIAYFLACISHYQWGLIVGFVIASTVILGRALGETSRMHTFVPEFTHRIKGIMTLVVLSMLPAMQELITRWVAARSIVGAGGSSLLTRIGISGDDPHNGGILGALQFLGGNRITVCLKDPGRLMSGGDINEKIGAFNCVLVTAGMAIVSVLAIYGVIFLIKKSPVARIVVFPLALALLIFAAVLQQSMSVHLLGYSYIFSFLFSAGLFGVIIKFQRYVQSNTLTLLVTTPVVVAVVLLSIRINLLSG